MCLLLTRAFTTPIFKYNEIKYQLCSVFLKVIFFHINKTENPSNPDLRPSIPFERPTKDDCSGKGLRIWLEI
jgi:hypothetical protein